MNTNEFVWSFNTDKVENWAFYDNAFSKEECQKIIEIGNKLSLVESTLGIENYIDKNNRDCKVSWISANSENEWIYRRLTDILMEINDKFFKFNVFGFLEGLQFTKYDSPNGKFAKHIDKSIFGKVRKLSISIQLSSPEDYEGGELALHISNQPSIMGKELGKLIAFPSYTLHEVFPVTKGTRYSLICWVSGEAFK
jgi:PKHD-type hydroxylase